MGTGRPKPLALGAGRKRRMQNPPPSPSSPPSSCSSSSSSSSSPPGAELPEPPRSLGAPGLEARSLPFLTLPAAGPQGEEPAGGLRAPPCPSRRGVEVSGHRGGFGAGQTKARAEVVAGLLWGWDEEFLLGIPSPPGRGNHGGRRVCYTGDPRGFSGWLGKVRSGSSRENRPLQPLGFFISFYLTLPPSPGAKLSALNQKTVQIGDLLSTSWRPRKLPPWVVSGA